MPKAHLLTFVLHVLHCLSAVSIILILAVNTDILICLPLFSVHHQSACQKQMAEVKSTEEQGPERHAVKARDCEQPLTSRLNRLAARVSCQCMRIYPHDFVETIVHGFI